MQAPDAGEGELREDLEGSSGTRAGRALTLIAISVLAIAAAGIAYVHPALALGSSTSSSRASPITSPVSYQLAGIDFVSATNGWVVAQLDSGDFAILHTADAGRHWARQLAGPTDGRAEYLRFFDGSHGVFVLLGPRALLFQTRDGGITWSRQQVQEGGGYVLSASFVDATHGWLLTPSSADPGAGIGELFRTADGAVSWVVLGQPAGSTDQPYRVVFADSNRGWLYSRSAGAYAYSTQDSGKTWQRVALPTPQGGWPAPQGQFFVAAQPTAQNGVVVTVVNFAQSTGRSAAGQAIVGYPPLTVHSFDGGSAITYTYSTSADMTPSSFPTDVVGSGPAGIGYPNQPPNELRMTSLDGGRTWSASPAAPVFASSAQFDWFGSSAPPTLFGTTAYVDATHWWWLASGLLYKTDDAGRTWASGHHVDVPTQFVGSLDLVDSNHAWLGGMIGTEPVVFTTANAGVQWTRVTLPPLTP